LLIQASGAGSIPLVAASNPQERSVRPKLAAERRPLYHIR